ncbi:SDR family NAD(P)-dependent oxidoreductase [Dysosmobacter sp.]|uniref:SDR family NAD(P)-dependent oxidoreductase n=1 Tax=Dysosmobacter sp. TaxID=2591382 RepID=UPI003AB7683B
MFDFTGQVIAITGASSGIGLEIARKFYLAGARLALCSRSEERVRSAVADWADTSDARLLIISADTSIIKNIYRFRDAAVERFGRIDVWVNNAGIEHPMPTVEMTQEIFDAVVNTNFRGYYFGCQSAAQDMLRRGEGGTIVNIGSVNAVTVVPGQAVYAATKAAISQMTKLFAREWGRDGIRVNCVGPGSIPTRINEEKYKVPGAEKAMREKIPMGRRGDVSEVADAVLYLASGEASYITGQTLFVDGGLTLVHG